MLKSILVATTLIATATAAQAATKSTQLEGLIQVQNVSNLCSAPITSKFQNAKDIAHAALAKELGTDEVIAISIDVVLGANTLVNDIGLATYCEHAVSYMENYYVQKVYK